MCLYIFQKMDCVVSLVTKVYKILKWLANVEFDNKTIISIPFIW